MAVQESYSDHGRQKIDLVRLTLCIAAVSREVAILSAAVRLPLPQTSAGQTTPMQAAERGGGCLLEVTR